MSLALLRGSNVTIKKGTVFNSHNDSLNIKDPGVNPGSDEVKFSLSTHDSFRTIAEIATLAIATAASAFFSEFVNSDLLASLMEFFVFGGNVIYFHIQTWTIKDFRWKWMLDFLICRDKIGISSV
ncbi:MAG: hypothetical protein CVV42_02930 [Candidatus Riflebacteria bacterium HGW-Riflebacteria-2]|nr:MAG: hypothetical protein CVV42_02930 [Candidatus Riflebacteria bacterium HGW-Riflebacteria-2]